jgi:ABC-type multidrug transport system permease subunit
MNSPLVQLIVSRIREFYREPAAIFWVYGFPLVLALGLGLAFPSRPVESVRVDMVAATDADREAAAALAAKWVERDPRLKVEVFDEATARNRLRTAKTALVVIPDSSAPAGYRYVADDNQPGSVLARAAADTLVLKSRSADTPTPPVEPLGNESGGRYIDFLMPGLIGVNLMGGGLFGVGFLIVDMRVRKLLKRFLATPMKKTDFMLSLMASRLIFTIAEIVILLAAAYFFFGVTVHGNWLALAVVVFLGGACFAGMGLLIASRAKTLETASGLMNAVMLPMYVVSGVFFSADNFPAAVQPVIQVLPLTALNNGLRAIINDGGGFGALVQPAAVLCIWGGLCFVLALKLFRWR